MSAAAVGLYRNYELPWTPDAESDGRYRRIRRTLLILLLIVSVIVPLLPRPVPEPADIEQVPPRLAKLVLEKKPPPPEPEPVRKPVEAPKPKPKPAEVTPKPVTPQPTKPQVTEERRAQAKEQAAKAGVNAFADELAALRESPSVSALTEGSAQVTGAPGEGPKNERSLITSKAGQASGGVNTAQVSRGTGGGGLAGRGDTRVDGPVSSVGGSGAGGKGAASAAGGSGGVGERSREEVELVFDRNKGSLFTLYAKALRSNPALQGKVVVQLTIEPDGSVSAVQLVSSELADAELEAKLLARVKSFRFEAKNVSRMTTTKPLDFFPS